MAKLFITGSTDGLGLFAAQQLIEEGHQVYGHARSASRSEDARDQLRGAADILVADLSSVAETKQLAAELNALGPWDAIIHNAGVMSGGGEVIFKVNTLAPYILSSLVELPQRLVYLSSGMHRGGRPLQKEPDISNVSYSDSKFLVTTLMQAVARLCPSVYANAVDPGWVPTKMGGASAPDDLREGYQTQIWLATSPEPEARVSGQYFYHRQPGSPQASVYSIDLQEKLLRICAEVSEVIFRYDTDNQEIK